MDVILPLACSQSPASDEAERQHENEQHGARSHSHQRLHDELGVKVDAIESADAARRRVREENAVQQHRATDEVETQEHRQREDEIDRYAR